MLTVVLYVVGGLVFAVAPVVLGHMAAPRPGVQRILVVIAIGAAPVVLPLCWFLVEALRRDLNPWADPKLPSFLLGFAPFSVVAFIAAWSTAHREPEEDAIESDDDET